MNRMFNSINKDGSGEITLHELLAACFPLATKGEVRNMVKFLRENHGSFRPTTDPSYCLSASEAAEARKIFSAMDRDKSGAVSCGEILAIVARGGTKLTMEDIGGI